MQDRGETAGLGVEMVGLYASTMDLFPVKGKCGWSGDWSRWPSEAIARS